MHGPDNHEAQGGLAQEMEFIAMHAALSQGLIGAFDPPLKRGQIGDKGQRLACFHRLDLRSQFFLAEPGAASHGFDQNTNFPTAGEPGCEGGFIINAEIQ